MSFVADRQKRAVMSFSEPKPKEEKRTFELFRQTLFWVLINAPNGLTWTDITMKAASLPKTPPAIWVRSLEENGWLERNVDPQSHKMIWKTRTRSVTPLDNSQGPEWARNTETEQTA